MVRDVTKRRPLWDAAFRSDADTQTASAFKRLASWDSAEDQQKYNGAKESHKDADQVEPGHVQTQERAGQEAANDGTDDTDHNIAQDTEAPSTHRHAG